MNEPKQKPRKPKIELRESAKPLASPETRPPLSPDHPASLLFAPALAALGDQSTAPVNQATSAVDQSTTPTPPVETLSLVDQSTSPPVDQNPELTYPSRLNRRKKGIWLPTHKLDHYEDWQHKNRRRHRTFQDLVEYAMDIVTGIPVDQSTSLPVHQSTALINPNDLTNLIINDPKLQRAAAKYSQVTGRPFNPNDYRAYLEVAHLDIGAIERGLEEGKRIADRLGKPMNGFLYARDPILREGRKTPPAPVVASELPSCERCRDNPDRLVAKYVDGERRGMVKCDHREGG